MRVILQRTKKAKCTVANKVTGQIENGYLLLCGFTPGDDEGVLARMAKKVVNLRIFNDGDGKMNLSILDVGGSILSVSQFTLYANTNAGNRPSFTDSLNPTEALVLYNRFNEMLANYNIKVETGHFGEEMEIELINDGPVTITLEFTK